MSNCPEKSAAEIDRRIRLSGRIGRFLCTTVLILGGAFSLWLTIAIALDPQALAKMNLTDERAAEIKAFHQDPAKLLALLETKPEAVAALAKAEKDALHFQELADHRLKRAGTVLIVIAIAALLLGFVWLGRRLFSAFAEGEVITPENARILKYLGVLIVVLGILTMRPGVAIAGILDITLAWSLRQALLLKAEHALVI